MQSYFGVWHCVYMDSFTVVQIYSRSCCDQWTDQDPFLVQFRVGPAQLVGPSAAFKRLVSRCMKMQFPWHQSWWWQIYCTGRTLLTSLLSSYECSLCLEPITTNDTRRLSSQPIAWIINVFNCHFSYCFITGELQTNSACLDLYQTAQEIITELRKPINV